MIRNALFLFLCFIFTGCASIEQYQLGQKYLEIFDNSLTPDEVTSIVKTETYQELKQGLSDIIVSQGYTKVIFEDPKKGFIVIAKEDDFDQSQIILKYTAIEGKYKTRIDLVKGSNDPSTNRAVKEDIKEMSRLIKVE